jgi:hypothetical protein
MESGAFSKVGAEGPRNSFENFNAL